MEHGVKTACHIRIRHFEEHRSKSPYETARRALGND
jgi:hypothetical protein